MSDLLVLAIIAVITWLVLVSGGDSKRDQERQKLRRAAKKHWKETHNV